MKGDFSRDSFNPAKHYAAVLKQQGRVDLDADWNEHAAIERHIEETTTRDVVGPSGAPQDNAGFQIGYTESGGSPDLTVSAGRIYVEGVLCELASATTYLGQADHPEPPALAPQSGHTDLVYLDVWQRHITQTEDPELREVALGGPDTATRIQTVAQVKVKANVGDVTCADEVPGWPPPPSGGLLTASVIETEAPDDLCTPAASGGYQGLENRLYRVEIHQGGGIGVATFKWSRDNGSVVYAVEEFIDGQPTNQLRLSSIGRDRVLRLRVGDWIEVLDDASELSSGSPATMAQITDLDEAERLITLGASISGLDLARHPKVRRWDQGQGAIAVTSATFDLEDGIQVSFSGSGFKAGDFWIFTARSITGEIEEFTDAPPKGIEHYYCALALVTWQQTSGQWTPTIHDCRNLFPPLTGLTRFFYVGGNGQEAMPGQPLPELLRVGVIKGQQPVEGALVSFAADKPGARVAATILGLAAAPGSSITVATGPDGIASCAWRLDNDVADPSQLLTSRLLDASEVATEHPPIYFNANLSIASQVWYDSTGCINPNNPDDVQEALDDLCKNYSIFYVGGDGQEAHPGHEVPFPLRVRIANGQWLVPGVRVNFRVTQGGGFVSGGTGSGPEIAVITNAEGIASAQWTLGSSGPQQLLAFMENRNDLNVVFNATLRTAESISFDPTNCDHFDESVTNVQDAIDALCKLGLGKEPGIHVTDILLSAQNAKLLNDSNVPVDVFAAGLRIVCDRPPDPNSLANKPVCFITLELPYPLNESDRTLWGLSTLIGFQPIILAARLKSDNNLIGWLPNGPTRSWLLDRLFQVLEKANMPRRVLARLTLKGNFVWDQENREMYLDGDGYGAPDRGRTDLVLPTGNGLRGGDLEMWFWLVPKAAEGPAVVAGEERPALVAIEDVAVTVRGTPITINVLANDHGARPLTIAAVTQPASGSAVAVAGNMLLTYVPAGNFVGTDTFNYTVRDSSGHTAQARVTVTVAPTPAVGVAAGVVNVALTGGALAAGARTEVSGSGFQPNETVSVVAMTSDGRALELGSVTVDSAGAFRTDISVSESIPPGDYTIKAVGEFGSQSGMTRITRIRNP